MSRSALWANEGNLKGKQRQAEDLFLLAVEEGRNTRQKNPLKLWGPDDSFHFNPMLLNNIVKSPYFSKCCRDITDWNTLVDEIYYQVKHLQPWAAGSSREPSTAFCLLLRLLTLRCSEKQMQLLLDHPDSPYIRGIGFLYLRFAGDPQTVWRWIEPYLYDEEPMQYQASSAKQKEKDTVGDFVRLLFTKQNYFGTMLPRLPIQMEREIQVKLLQAEKIEARAKTHASNKRSMDYFEKLGSRCMALYGDDENPTTWYDAVIDRVVTTNEETRKPLRQPKFVVTFPAYGNTETVFLGELEMPGANTGALDQPRRGGFLERDNDHNHEGSYTRRDGRYNQSDNRKRGYDGGRNRGNNGNNNIGREDRGYDNRRDQYRGRDNDRRGNYGDDKWDRRKPSYGSGRAPQSEEDLYEEVRRRERETAATGSRSAVSRRPPSNKSSLTSDHSGRPSLSSPPCSRKHSPPREQLGASAPGKIESAHAPRKRTAEELAAIREKKRRLMAKYG